MALQLTFTVVYLFICLSILGKSEVCKGFEEKPLIPVRSIAEWEPMEGVLIRYPFGIPYDFIALLSEEINVITVVNGQIEENYLIEQYSNNGVNLDNCTFLHALANSYWTRDYGPLYIMTGENEIAGVDYNYRFENHTFSNDIPLHLTEFLNVPYYNIPDLTFDGTSNLMTDGMGKAASSLYALSLNPELTQSEIEEKVFDFLGIETFHFIQQYTAGHHIDTWAKFLSPDKIIIHQVPEDHPAYEYYENAAEYFKNQMSSYNRPYRVFRVQTPNNEPYANSLILNNRVFVPITGNHENDFAALKVYEDAMPGYQIHGVYYEGFTSGDAVHCRTQEVPDRGMLHIYHVPFPDACFQENEYVINAKIVPLSGEAVCQDCVILNYKLDDNDFQVVVMTSDSADIYTATIPKQLGGTEISYFISAEDYSGRNEKHPYIGKYDPHTFTVKHPFTLIELSVDDSEFGNNNSTFEKGETVELIISFRNDGNDVIKNPLAKLTTQSENLHIHPSGSDKYEGEVEIGETVIFRFGASASLATPDSYIAKFRINFITENGYDGHKSFELQIPDEDINYGIVHGNITLNSGEGDISEVLINAGGQIAFSDIAGLYSIAVHQGSFDIFASLKDYDADTVKNLSIEQGDTLVVNFLLNSISNSLESKKYDNVSVFPNPTNEYIYIKSEKKFSNVKLLNSEGRQLAAYTFNDFTAKINVAEISAGLYYLAIRFPSHIKIRSVVVWEK